MEPPPPDPYSLRAILASSSTATSSDLASAPSRLASNPCLRPSLVWAAAIGGLLALHRRRAGASLRRCALDGYLGATFTLGCTWYGCRRAERDRSLTMAAYYASLKGGAVGGAGRGLTRDGGAPVETGAGEGGAWREQLDGLVAGKRG